MKTSPERPAICDAAHSAGPWVRWRDAASAVRRCVKAIAVVWTGAVAASVTCAAGLLTVGMTVARAQNAPLVPMLARPDASAGAPGTDTAWPSPPSAQSTTAPMIRPGLRGQRLGMAAMSHPVAASAPAAQSDAAAPAMAESPPIGSSSTQDTAVTARPASRGDATAWVAPPLPRERGTRKTSQPSPTVPGTDAISHRSGAPSFAHAAKPPADDARITLDLDHVDASEAIRAFAEFTGLNIVASAHVRGSVTLSLNAVPWRQAFATLLDTNGLAMRMEGSVIWVAPAAEIAQRDKLQLETQAKMAALEPLVTRTFALRYQRADDVRKLLAGSGGQRMLSKRGAATADARTDHLFVSDTSPQLAQIAAMIAAIDVPPRQVLIESRIVEADASFDRNLGARLALLGGATGNGDSIHGVHGDDQGNLYDLSAGGLNGYQPASLGVTLFSAGDSRELMLQLSALEAEGHGRTVSSPRVVTADRVRALVEQGTELPYQSMVDTGVPSVQFRRATLKLEVIPHITPDHHVMLDVDVTKDSVGQATTAGPAIDTKHVQTQVEVENGGTVAIGGIYIDEGRNDTNGVPWFDHLPVLGWLFRNRAVSNSKNELMIFITPTEVDGTALKLAAASRGSMPAADGRIPPATATPFRMPAPALPPVPELPGGALSVRDWPDEIRSVQHP